jgi:hypothetical protein
MSPDNRLALSAARRLGMKIHKHFIIYGKDV